MAFIHCNNVVQQIAAATLNPTFRNTVLPRTSNEVRTGLIFRGRTGAGTSPPYLPSRSKIRNRGADSNGKRFP